MREERRNRGEWNNQGNRIEERKKKVGMETKKKGEMGKNQATGKAKKAIARETRKGKGREGRGEAVRSYRG